MDFGALMQQSVPEDSLFSKIAMPPVFFGTVPALFPILLGTELFIDLPNVKEKRITFRFDIALDEAQEGIIQAGPLMETVEGMLTEVENVVKDFEPLTI